MRRLNEFRAIIILMMHMLLLQCANKYGDYLNQLTVDEVNMLCLLMQHVHVITVGRSPLHVLLNSPSLG